MLEYFKQELPLDDYLPSATYISIFTEGEIVKQSGQWSGLGINPKKIGILIKLFCTSGPSLLILAWKDDELFCRKHPSSELSKIWLSNLILPWKPRSIPPLSLIKFVISFIINKLICFLYCDFTSLQQYFSSYLGAYQRTISPYDSIDLHMQ